ncbi:MAG: DNA gyrase inhibitor YacG [Planctomyces sp.]|nr:DNA gyrase inhibitor YacG [Planctomyces sp.]
MCGAALPDGPARNESLDPFCSVRCRQIDLWKWCEGQYAVVETLDDLRLLEAAGELDPDSELRN